MVTLNNWSHGLYYFLSACAEVEHYRNIVSIDPEKAAALKKTAIETFAKVPEHIGKRKIMSKQLPFDVFINRKLQKWAQRATLHNVDLVDAIGTSPLTEMTFFWNGFKRMSTGDLNTALETLRRSKTAPAIPWADFAVDEHAIYHLLEATILRNLGQNEEARATLQDNIISKPRADFKGETKDAWPHPVAHYEVAVTYWQEYLISKDVKCLESSQTWLNEASGWGESYDLDNR
jgi:hypothetical protein